MLAASTEVAAVTAIMVCATLWGQILAVSGFQDWSGERWLAALAPMHQLLVLIGATILLGALLTPLFNCAIALSLLAAPIVVKSAGIDAEQAAALLVLPSLAAMMLRSIRRRAEPPPIGASSISLSLPVALLMIGVTVAITILTAAAFRYLPLAPTR
jgi:hypothetical protein